jgi:surfactin synthase thioesterase subunit
MSITSSRATPNARLGRPLLRVTDPDAHGRVFCLPYSGVGASMFNRWPRWLREGIEICPVQLPARENRIREPAFATYHELADQLVEALTPYFDRPFVLFGHCAGALSAYELARRLTGEASRLLRRLVVSAQVAPHDCPHDRLLELDDEGLRRELIALTVARGGEPDPLMLDLALRVLKTDLEASRRYGPEAPRLLEGSISVVHWNDDPEVSADELAGWSQYAREVSRCALPGEHYTFLTAPHALLDVLADSFEAAR